MSLNRLSKDIVGVINDEGSDFTYTMYINPHKKIKDKPYIDNLVTLFGNRKQLINGKYDVCLGIDETSVRNNIDNGEFLAMIYVENANFKDSATGTLQYYNWYKNKSLEKQIWINDLCRINDIGKHTKISPVKVLLDVIYNFCKDRKINDMYLMVEDDKPGTNKLIKIYKQYGFYEDNTYELNNNNNGTEYIIMKKSIKNITNKRNTNKRNNNKRNNNTIKNTMK
jgi:hypothetical protein